MNAHGTIERKVHYTKTLATLHGHVLCMYMCMYVCMYALGCLWCNAKVLVYLLGCLPSKQLEAFSFPLLPTFILMGQGRSPTSGLRLNRGITWSIAVEHIGCEHTHTHTYTHTHAYTKHTHTHAHTHAHTHTHTRTHAHTHMHTHVCTMSSLNIIVYLVLTCCPSCAGYISRLRKQREPV